MESRAARLEHEAMQPQPQPAAEPSCRPEPLPLFQSGVGSLRWR
jgi:hypothetical protein